MSEAVEYTSPWLTTVPPAPTTESSSGPKRKRWIRIRPAGVTAYDTWAEAIEEPPYYDYEFIVDLTYGDVWEVDYQADCAHWRPL